MKNKDKKNSSGLTLVEVLLSIIILSIGVSTLMLATNRCLTVIKRAQNRDIAQNLIRQINTDHPIVKIDLDEKIENGDFEKFENFFWEREILFADLENTPGLFLINLTISWLEKGKNSSETISYYIYAPEAERVSRKIN